MVAILNKRTALSGKDAAMSSAIIQYFKEHEIELYALSIGFNKGMYALIDHAYDENREGYYEPARQWIAEHPAEAKQLFIYGVQTDKRIQKALGIILYSLDIQDSQVLDRLFNKGFPVVKTFVKSHKGNQTFDDYFRKRYNDPQEVDFMRMLSEVGAAIYFGSKTGTPVAISETMLGLMSSYLTPSHTAEEHLVNAKAHPADIHIFCQKYHLPVPKEGDSYTIFGYLDKTLLTAFRMDAPEVRRVSSRITAIADYYDFIGIDGGTLNSNIPLTGEEVLLAMQYTLKTIESMADEDLDELMLFISLLYQTVVSHLYRETKQIAVVNSEEEFIEKSLKLEKELKKRSVKLEQEAQKAVNEKNRYKDLYEKALELTREQEKAIRQMEKEKEKTLSYEQEVIGLRNFLYQLEKDAQAGASIDAADSFEADLSFLKENRIALFGGHPNFLTKIKEVLPDIRILNPDEKNKSLSFVSNQNAVFVFTDYFNHGFYYRLVKSLPAGLPLIYLKPTVNVEQTIQNMAKQMRERLN